MVYFVVFVTAALCFWCGQKVDGKIIVLNNISIKISDVIVFMGIFPLCILAGFRSPDIGTDVKTYVIYSWNRVQSYKSFIDLWHNHYLEIGYESLEYVLSWIFKDVHWLHFVTALIIICGVWKFTKCGNGFNPLCASMFIFICMNYNQSFSAIRQWLALSIYMRGGGYLRHREAKKYFAICIIAILFHYSAIITLPIYFIYGFLKRNYKNQVRAGILLTLTFILVLYFDRICMLLIGIGILPAKYSHYFIKIEGASSLMMQIMARLPLILGGAVFYKRMVKRDSESEILYCFMLMDLLFGILASRFGYASRFSLYFSVWQIIYMSELYETIRLSVKTSQRKIITFLFYGILMTYWIYYYAFRGFNNTYPYVSDILK